MPAKTKPTKPVPFSLRPRIERAKAVARDVLRRYKAGQLKLSPGILLKSKGDLEELDLQKRLKAGRECSVCALGSVACGLAVFEDKLSLIHNNTYTIDGGVVGYLDLGLNVSLNVRLNAILGGDLARKTIECAFEDGQGVYHYSPVCFTPAQKSAIQSFVAKHPTHESRFLAIWRQIARTGSFKP